MAILLAILRCSISTINIVARQAMTYEKRAMLAFSALDARAKDRALALLELWAKRYPSAHQPPLKLVASRFDPTTNAASDVHDFIPPALVSIHK